MRRTVLVFEESLLFFFRGIEPDSRGCVNTEVIVNVRLKCSFCILRAVFSVESVELVKHTQA